MYLYTDHLIVFSFVCAESTAEARGELFSNTSALNKKYQNTVDQSFQRLLVIFSVFPFLDISVVQWLVLDCMIYIKVTMIVLLKCFEYSPNP